MYKSLKVVKCDKKWPFLIPSLLGRLIILLKIYLCMFATNCKGTYGISEKHRGVYFTTDY